MGHVALNLIAVAMCFVVYLLAGIRAVLYAVHRELVRIRCETTSLHDRVVPEVFMRSWERKHGRP